MPDAAPNPALLRSLGKLARGLSCLFWGLPAALLVCANAVRGDIMPVSGLAPVAASLGVLCFGLWLMGDFQKQERPWRAALDRATFTALVNLGLSPFLFWWSRVPGETFFLCGVGTLAVSGLVFLFNLNLVLARLGAMLPDETLRQETKLFTGVNRVLLVTLVAVAAGAALLFNFREIPLPLGATIVVLNRAAQVALLLLLLLPLAMTMALIWKTKEVILESVFGARTG